MRTRQRFMSMGLCLIAVLLVLTASAAADGGGAIPYWGDYVVDLTTLPDGTPIGPGTASVQPLPGGRLYLEWVDGSEYQVGDGVATDLSSGDWYFQAYAIQQPSGAMKIWGSVLASYLDYFGGLGCGDEGGGGWQGTFQGVILANGDAIISATNEGCGALEGWRQKHHEEWRGFDADTGVYASRTFSGHAKPPSH